MRYFIALALSLCFTSAAAANESSAAHAVATVASKCQEDDPCWNWSTMGNHQRGVTLKGHKSVTVVKAKRFCSLTKAGRISPRTPKLLGDDICNPPRVTGVYALDYGLALGAVVFPSVPSPCAPTVTFMDDIPMTDASAAAHMDTCAIMIQPEQLREASVWQCSVALHEYGHAVAKIADAPTGIMNHDYLRAHRLCRDRFGN